MQALKSGKWEEHRKGDSNPCYNIREELYEAEGMLMSEYRVVVSRRL